MAAILTSHAVADTTPDALEVVLHTDDLEPRWWSNRPGERYATHSHPYRKVLFCAEGSIVFHTDQGDFEMRPGDRLDIDAATEHAATVGPQGVTCVEAPVPPTP